MSEIGEAAGGLIGGALVARSVEPDAGEKRGGHGGHAEVTHCLNCGTELVGPHCHACGQPAHVHRTLGAFFHDLLHGVLHFEGKLWRTLPKLVLRPGVLTREYIDGKRASYISPIALFLFVVFVSFATFQMLGGGSALTPEIDLDARTGVEREFESTTAQLEERRSELEAARADAAAADGDAADAAEPDAASTGEDVARLERSVEDLERQQSILAGALEAMGSDTATEGIEAAKDVSIDVETKSAWQKAKENPQLLVYKMQTNAYKFAWLLIPISVPFVWLLYFWKRRFHLYDHTIFTTYSITFMLALAGVSGLLVYLGTFQNIAGLQVVGAILPLYAPYHMYRQLRGTYASSRIGALVRMVLLSAFAWIAIGLFTAVLASMT